jgi:hypothetical protein
MISGAARRRARVDAAVAAYTQWRSERDAVRAAYRVGSAAGAFGEPLAFETYQSALDREKRAATTYAGQMSRVGHLAETGLAHQLAHAGAPGNVVSAHLRRQVLQLGPGGADRGGRRQRRARLAADALQRLSDTTRPSGTDWALGIEARSRALLSAGDAADELYREAIERLPRTRMRVKPARAHRLYGE